MTCALRPAISTRQHRCLIALSVLRSFERAASPTQAAALDGAQGSGVGETVPDYSAYCDKSAGLAPPWSRPHEMWTQMSRVFTRRPDDGAGRGVSCGRGWSRTSNGRKSCSASLAGPTSQQGFGLASKC